MVPASGPPPHARFLSPYSVPVRQNGCLGEVGKAEPVQNHPGHWGADVLPGLVEVLPSVGHPTGSSKALAQGAGGHISESLFLPQQRAQLLTGGNRKQPVPNPLAGPWALGCGGHTLGLQEAQLRDSLHPSVAIYPYPAATGGTGVQTSCARLGAVCVGKDPGPQYPHRLPRGGWENSPQIRWILCPGGRRPVNYHPWQGSAP